MPQIITTDSLTGTSVYNQGTFVAPGVILYDDALQAVRISDTLVNYGSILSGSVSSTLGMTGSIAALINHGTISSSSQASADTPVISLTTGNGGGNIPSETVIINTGTIDGLGRVVVMSNSSGDQNITIDNSGTMRGGRENDFFVANSDMVELLVNNSGTMIGGDFAPISGGRTLLTNTGSMEFSLLRTSTSTASEVNNLGGTITITNNGFAGDLRMSTAFDLIENSGVINARVFTSTGGDTIINSGTVNGLFNTGFQNDRLTNSGTINGSVDLSFNDDIMTNTGTVTGLVDLGTGNDLYNGLGNSLVADVVIGDGGDDTLRGGINDDRLDGGDDADFVAGRDGNDELMGGAGGDVLLGGRGDDSMDGGTGIDTLRGGSGDDVIKGDAGNDDLRGGSGDDTLQGGTGRDRLFGESGEDVFQFLAVSDSALGGVDKIYNFNRGQDLVDIDALSATDIQFAGTGGHTGGGTASVRYVTTSLGVSVRVDADGNGSSDMFILMLGTDALAADDFIL